MSGMNFVELFAGIGAFHRALGQRGAKCVFASEIDAACQDVYESNHGMRPLGDITKIDAKDVPPHDILCAGFPCQPFSISGNQRGFEDDRGQLFYQICRICEAHSPPYLLLENVKNLVSHDKGRTMRTIKDMLVKLGYRVYFKLMNAGHYGVPQSRSRVFFFCTRLPLDFQFPYSEAPRVFLRDVLEQDVDPSLAVDLNSLPHKISHVEPECDLVPIRIGQVNLGRQGERVYHPNGHSITLSSGGGGIGGKTGLYKVGDSVRRLSPRECARLTGFPDDFKLHPSPHQCYRQFGNCLVVNVASSILDEAVGQGFFR